MRPMLTLCSVAAIATLTISLAAIVWSETRHAAEKPVYHLPLLGVCDIASTWTCIALAGAMLSMLSWFLSKRVTRPKRGFPVLTTKIGDARPLFRAPGDMLHQPPLNRFTLSRRRTSAVPDATDEYKAPETVAELLAPYAAGERQFPNTDLEASDLSGATLEGALFDGSFFHSANFEGANLCGASFRACNVKGVNSRRADLRAAAFSEASVEAAKFEEARLNGMSFEGAGYYGRTIHDGNGFPHGRAAAGYPSTGMAR